MTEEPENQLRRTQSLTAQAAEHIRERIMRGDFELGAPLSENSLAAELGVSKTPVREALLQLQSEGLVSVQPQRGSFVFEMDAQEIVELGELRETLEIAALELSVRRNVDDLAAALRRLVTGMAAALERGDIVGYRLLDRDFHQAFFDHCGNRFLQRSYHGISARVQALRTRLSVDSQLNRSSFDDHQALCELIEQGRESRASALLASHVRGTNADYTALPGSRRAAPGA